ncbi:universal stress protein [Mycolicibacterium sp. 120270]|uniref:universal stress protein n=1 Tax=Mycolicibacterium sp. 120270 TaxID=3090600 RepID=UPI00299DD702|nr:universal stress protein [Mycolicibacterium sp. 120270]MDX1886389.1 universal stress protein [Mycolicibacterium sp. 120270]
MSDSVTHRGVVVAVDGSAPSKAATAWATHDAAMRNLPLTLVHVVVPVAPSAAISPEFAFPSDYFTWQEDQAARVLDEARRIVEDAPDEAKPRVVNTEVLHGGAVSALVDLSKDADMVVVGSRGLGAFSRVLLGSVSTGLVHHAHCPVAVIHDDAPEVGEDAPVLVGIDGSPASIAATEIAFDEASRRGVDLIALHAWRDITTVYELPGLDVKRLQEEAQLALSEQLAGFGERYPDVSVHKVVVADRPSRQLIEHAKSAQLVVVGSHGRGGFAGMLLGSVSTAVVHAVKTPTIVARSG